MTTIIKLLQQIIYGYRKSKEEEYFAKNPGTGRGIWKSRKGRPVSTYRLLPAVKRLNDYQQTASLMVKLYETVKSDPVHGRGNRTVTAGYLTFLEGFDFNPQQQLGRILMTRFETTIDRKTGQCTLHIPEFIPLHDIHYEGNITHVVITASAAVLDFERESFVADTVKSKPCAVNEPVNLTLQPVVTAHSTLPILLALRIQFYQVVNGHFYIIGGGGKTVLSFVKVENALQPQPSTKRT